LSIGRKDTEAILIGLHCATTTRGQVCPHDQRLSLVKMDGLVPAAFVGGLVAILSAHVRFRVPPRDEHVSHAQRDLVDVSLAEVVGAQVVSFQKLGRR
jgi:hypothetical protein